MPNREQAHEWPVLTIGEVIRHLPERVARTYTFMYFETLESTNTTAREIVQRDGLASAGTVVIADTQTQGRGRMGRRWLSEPGSALTVSVISNGTVGGAVTIAGALAVSDTLRNVGLRPVLKWPNDVLLSGKKVCGLLAESAGSMIILGMGLNVWSVPVEVREWATYLAAHSDVARINRSSLLADLLIHLDTWLRIAEITPDRVWQSWAERLETLGRTVIATLPDGTSLRGNAVDVTATGSLVIDDGQTRHIVHAADVTLTTTPHE